MPIKKNIESIISRYLNIPEENLSYETLIDRTAIKGSIMLSRMYSEIRKMGVPVTQDKSIKTYGDLLTKLGYLTNPVLNYIDQIKNNESVEETSNEETLSMQSTRFNNIAIGIDIESYLNMPDSNNFRAEQFYIDHFSQAEISHCIVNQNPKESFAGLFACKEAIVKASNEYLTTPFNQIIISHDKNGKPYFKGDWQVSISHSNGISVAIALKILSNDTSS